MVGAALRAANRYLMSLMCTACVMNGAILLAVAVAPLQPPLELFSWIFFGGSLPAAAVAHGFARRVFGPAPAHTARDEPRRTAWAQIGRQIEEEAGIGFANVALLWAPLGLLVALTQPTEMALFAVSTRSAQLILYLMPVLALLVAPRLGRLGAHLGGAYGRSALRLALSGVALASAAMAALLIVAAPWGLPSTARRTRPRSACTWHWSSRRRCRSRRARCIAITPRTGTPGGAAHPSTPPRAFATPLCLALTP